MKKCGGRFPSRATAQTSRPDLPIPFSFHHQTCDIWGYFVLPYKKIKNE